MPPTTAAVKRSSTEEQVETLIYDWTKGPLGEGLCCYRNQEFFLAHEHWEHIWLTCQEPDKSFLQALIQVTAAFHHLQRKNVKGASSLLSAALRRLNGFSADYGGIAVAVLRQGVETWIYALEFDSNPPQISFPTIRQTGKAAETPPIE